MNQTLAKKASNKIGMLEILFEKLLILLLFHAQ